MAKKHVHKYYRMQMNGYKVWACALPDCTHYMPRHLESMVTRKTSICWECNEEFQLGPFSLRREKPICDSCDPTSNSLMDAIEKLGIQPPK